MSDKKKKLYDALSQRYNMGTFEQFAVDIDNEEKRKKLYDSASKIYALGDFDTFSKDLGYEKQAPAVEPAKPVIGKPVEVEAPQNKEAPVQVEPDNSFPIFDDNPNPPINPEQETVRGFGAGFKQGIKQMGSGLKALGGEIANLFTGTTRDEREALEEIERREALGIDVNNPDQDFSAAFKQYQETLAANPTLSRKEKRKLRRTFLNDMSDKMETQFLADVEQLGWAGAQSKLQKEKNLQTRISDILDETNGDVAAAKKILKKEINDPTAGDKLIDTAIAELGDMKPTEGFGAWVGGLIPQMIPSAAAMAVGVITKNPTLGKVIGGTGMGVMVGTTAGASMAEAREYGASDAQTWGVGLADAFTEYITEKIPFDRYTKRVFSGTKSKMAKEIGDALSNSKEAKTELNDLLSKANKQLGGKLFSKDNIVDYATDMLAEGVSEFAAEAIQTITPMIYANPEDYPTLGEIVANGWEGMKAGLFMGSVLGGASKSIEHAQHRSRRKQQGHVDVASVNFGGEDSDGSEIEVVEILGQNDKGEILALRDNEIVTVQPDNILEQHSFTYEEFESGRIQNELDEAFDNGYGLEEPQELNDAKNMYEYQRQKMRDSFIVDDTQLDDSPGYWSQYALNLQNVGDQETANTIIDYLNARATYDGMIQRVRDDIAGRIEASDKEIDSHTHSDGYIHPATMTTDRKVYVVNGTVVMHDDGKAVDRSKSDESVIIRDAETGKLEFVSPHDILAVDEAIDPVQEKEVMRQQISQTFAQEAAGKIDGVLSFMPGDTYTGIDENGGTHTITVVADENGIYDNGDGTVNVSMDGTEPVAFPKELISAWSQQYGLNRAAEFDKQRQEQRKSAREESQKPQMRVFKQEDLVTIKNEGGTPVKGWIDRPFDKDNNRYHVHLEEPIPALGGRNIVLTPEQLNNLAVEHNGEVINNIQYSDEGIAETPPTPVEPTDNGTGNDTSPVADSTSPTAEQQSALSRIPVNEQGQQVFESAPAGDTWAALIEMSDGDKEAAMEIASGMLANAQDALAKAEKASKKAAKGATPFEISQAIKARKVAIESAKKNISYWESVVGYEEAQAKQAEEEKRRERRLRMAEARRIQQQKGRYSEEDKQLGDHIDFRDYVMRTLARGGVRLKWSDSPDGVIKGLASHLGFKGNQSEQAQRIWLLSNEEGLYPEAAAEALLQGYADTFGMTDGYAEDIAGISGIDAFNEMLDVILTHGNSHRGMFDAAAARHAEATQDMDDYAEGLMQHNLEIEAEANGMTVEEWQTYLEVFEAQMQEAFDAMSDEEFNSIFVELYTQQDYDTSRTGAGVREPVHEGQGPENGYAGSPQMVFGEETDLSGRVVESTEEQTEPPVFEQSGFSHVPAAETSGEFEVVGDLPTDEEFAAMEAAKTAAQVEEARAQVDPDPTEAQKEAGNYRKGHVKIDGLDITIENPKGGIRKGTDKNGKKWQTEMANDYGYIRGSQSVDGDHIDIFLSDNPTEGKVYVVDQINPDTQEFDEHKVMYGFNSAEEAEAAYLANYTKGWKGLGNITEVSKEDFKKWLDSSHRKTKPFSEYKKFSKPAEDNADEFEFNEYGVCINPEVISLPSAKKGWAQFNEVFIAKHNGKWGASASMGTSTSVSGSAVAKNGCKYDTKEEAIAVAYRRLVTFREAHKSDSGLKDLDNLIKHLEKTYPALKAAETTTEAKEEEQGITLSQISKALRPVTEEIVKGITLQRRRELYDELMRTLPDAMIEAIMNVRGSIDIDATYAAKREYERRAKEAQSVPKTDVSVPKETENVPEQAVSVPKEQGYSITPAQYTTKKGKVLDMHLITFSGDLTKEQLRAAKELAKEEKGWYDRAQGGFMMRSPESAQKLAETILKNGEGVAEAQPVSLTEISEVSDGSISVTETAPVEQGPKFRYSIRVRPSGYTVIEREDVSGKIPVEDGNFRIEAENPLEMREILANNGMQSILDELGQQFDYHIDKWQFRQTADTEGFNGYKIGEEVMYQGAKVKIHDFEEYGDHRPVLDTGLAPVMYVVGNWEDISKIDAKPVKPQQIDVEGLIGALNQHGEARLSDHAMPDYSELIFSSFGKPLTAKDGKHSLRIKNIDGAKRTVIADVNTASVGGDNLTMSFDEIADILNGDNWGEAKPNPSGNKLVTDERYAELRERMRKKLGGQMNMGIDPEILAIGTEMAVYHIEKGARKFIDFAQGMIEDLGDMIRPYLKAFYNGARELPEVSESGLADEMTPYDEVRTFDLSNFGKSAPDAFATAEHVVKEQEVGQQAEAAANAIKKTRQKPKKSKKSSVSSEAEMSGGLFAEAFEEADNAEYEAQREFVRAVMSDMLAALDSDTKPYRSILDIRKRASGIGMEVDNEGRSDILLQELVEDGLVRAARTVIGRHGRVSRRSFDLICKLYEMQPTIAARSSNRIKMQQYSTPLPMAWVANRFAMANKSGGKVLEPTAGNGMLVFTVPVEQVHANELDETRLANLREQGFAQVTQQDATEQFEGGPQYDVIIANPPFGKSEAREYDGKPISGLDPQITLNALASMKDDGRAAIIIGGNMEYAGNGGIKSMKSFFTYLYDHYNVKGVVDMSGSMYAKQGTTFPTRMILIEGRRSEEERAQTAVYPPVESMALRKAENFDDLYEIVDVLLNSSDKTNGTEVLRSQGGRHLPDTDDTSRNSDRVGHQGQSAKNDARGSGTRGRGRTELEGGTPQGGRPVLGEHRQDPSVGKTGRRTDTAGRTGDVGGRSGQRTVGNGSQPVDRLETQRSGLGLAQESRKRELNEEKLPYRPHNTAFSLESVAPAAMVEAMDRVLSQIEEKHGNIDEFIRSELGYSTIEEAHNALAAEQMDSVAMAIYQMKQGQALIIGDQTGVGKGRQMAALIRWAVNQGEKPIFITQKADLFSDIYRDLVDIGSGDLKPFIFNSPSAKENKGEMVDSSGKVVHKGLSDAKMKKVLESGILPDEYDFAVLTYSQVNTGDEVSQQEANNAAKKSGRRAKKSKSAKSGKPTPKATFLRGIAENNYLFLDESHTAAGSSNTGLYLQSIIKSAKAVTFASATFAKRPDTMPLYAIRTAMSQAKVEPEKMIEIIEKGGVTLQEIMSRELTNAGQMVRRERDMTGVITDWKTITDEKIVRRARENYDRTIAAFNAIIKFQDDYVKPMIAALDQELAVYAESAGIKRGTDKLGVENVPFASKTYNYTKQLMLALKVDAIVDEVAAEIEAGRHPVIALESTMESSIKDYSIGEIIEEPTFSASLLKGLETVMQYTVKDENGKDRHERYLPHQLGPAGEKAYYELQDFIRESTTGIFISPLDAIIEGLHTKGYKVGELTGRDMYVERNDNGSVVVRKRTDKDKKRMQREFNNGTLDVLILNKSASTGISLHASEKFSDQRQRSMIIAQPLSDINDYMQMIGRIDRTGQVHRGYYINLGLPVPAENRFLMMLSTKLKSLNANTTTSQDSESNDVDAPDLLNKYGSQVVVEYLRDNPEIYERMGAPLKGSKEGSGKLSASQLDEYTPQEDDARKVTGYVALLPTKEQEDFYDDVIRRYNDLIRYLNDTGTNDLKITVMPLRAVTIDRRVSSEGIDPNGNNPFARNSFVERVEMDVLRKPLKASDIRRVIDQINKGTDPGEYMQRVLEIIDTEDEARLAAEEARHERAKAKAIEDIEKQREKIQRQQKRTEEEKAAAIEKFITETNEKVEARHTEGIARLNAGSTQLLRRLRMFEVGKAYLVPENLESGIFDFASPAIFCGYKTKDSKITASTTLAVFATLDGRRRVEVKLSQGPALLGIERATNDNWDVARQTTLDNWDSQIPTETRKVGYIMTGNILQAIADTQDERGGYPGQLISYTDMEGNIHDGILMPDKWNASMLKTSGAPLTGRMQQIREYLPIESHDGKVQITGSKWIEMYYLSVPKTKKDGAIFYENAKILKLVHGHGFYPSRGQLRADISAENIEAVVKELTRLGVKVKEESDDLYRMDYGEDKYFFRGEDFGEIYEQFRGKPQEAISFLLKEKSGEAVGALTHKDIGDISIVYGNDRAGLKKIAEKHPEVLNDLQGVIDGMEIIVQSENRIKLESATHYAVISKDHFGKTRAPWLLTAFEKKNSVLDNTMDTGETSKGSKQNDTATLQDTVSSNNKGSNNSDKNNTDVLTKAAEAFGNQFGGVEIVADINEITDSNPRVQNSRRKSKGWFNKTTGKAVVVIPNNYSIEDVKETILHEVVGHKGLIELVGKDNFNAFLDDLYRFTSRKTRERIVEYAKKHGWDFHYGAQEYIAELAEKGFSDRESASFWGMIRDYFVDMFRKAKIILGFNISDNDLRYMLWRSYQMQQSKGAMGVAEDMVMKQRLHVGNFRKRNPVPESLKDSDAEEILMRRGKAQTTSIRDRYESEVNTGKKGTAAMTWYNFMEAFQDEMRSLKLFQRAVEEHYGTKLKDFENAYEAENHLSSTNMEEFERFEDGIYKEALKIVDDWCRVGNETALSINRYMIAKHGLERNREFTVRDYIAERIKEADKKAAEAEKKAAEADKKEYESKRNQLRKDFADGKMTFIEFNEKSDQLAKQYAGDSEIKDYSGLVAITGSKDDFRNLAEQLVTEFEARHDNYQALWDAIGECTKATLRKSYDSGLMKKELYDHISSMFAWYVPMRGFKEDTAEDIYSYIGADTGAFSPTVKMAKGHSLTESDDIIAIIGNMMQSAILQGNRNVMKQHFLDMVQNYPTDLITEDRVWIVKQADGTWKSDYPNITENMTADEIATEIEAHKQRMTVLHAKKEAKILKGKPKLDYIIEDPSHIMKHAVKVMRGGEQYILYVNGNPRLAQALNGELKDKAQNIVVQMYDKYMRWYTASKTSYDVNFIPANAIRDTQHALLMTYIQEGAPEAFKFFINGWKMIPIVVKGASGKTTANTAWGRKMMTYWDEFLRYGGETGYSHLNKVDDFKDMHAKRIARLKGLAKAKAVAGNSFEYIKEAFEFANRIAEDITRFNAYVRSREQGKTVSASISNAKNITVNFNKKGSGQTIGIFGAMANIFRRWVPFANPMIQGLYQFLNVGAEHKARFAAVCSSQIALGFAIPFLNEVLIAALGGDDEDDYMNQTDYTRRNNLMIFTGSGYIKIPLAPMFRELYGMGDIFYSNIKGYTNSGQAARESLNQIRSMFSLEGQSNLNDEEFSFLRFFLPGHIEFFADAEQNVTFTGAPLYKEDIFETGKPEFRLVYKDTWTPLVDISRGLNRMLGGDDANAAKKSSKWINPAVWQHVLSELGGGPLKFIGDITGLAQDALTGEFEDNFSWYKIPVAKRFYTKPDERTVNRRLNEDFYDYVDGEYKRTENAANNYRQEIRMGAMEYAEILNNFMQTPEFKRYVELKGYVNAVSKMNSSLKYADKTQREEIEQRINEIKQQLVNELHEEE